LADGQLEFLKTIGAARIGAMAGVAAALTGFFLYIAGVITEPPKSVLYSGLDARDASAVTAKLQSLNVPFEQGGDGGTILVPSDKVLKLRMDMAAENLPSAGVGYEIFDKTDGFGTTAFVQNINRLRALEGELARSIRSINTIDDARVHLVIPDQQVFARNNQTPSASVILKSRVKLERGQVAAIQHLVAAAVSGLTPDAVAIVDDKGTLLAGGPGNQGDSTVAATEEERTSDFEERMRQRVEAIVASIVGQGHVRVEIAADMDFNKVTQNSGIYDPDSKVVRSSQTVQQDSSEKDGSSGGAVSVANALPGQTSSADSGNTKSANTRNEETINYEISKKTVTEVQEVGRLNKLSVAVVVDGKHETAKDGSSNYTPLSTDDMAKITALVKSAIGYDEKRGDQLQVTNLRFAGVDIGPEAPVAQPLLGLDSGIWFKLGEILILSITALLVGLFVVRPMIYRLTAQNGPSGRMPVAQLPGQTSDQNAIAQAGESQAQIAGPKGVPQLSAPRQDSMIDINQIEGQVRESSIRKVGEVVGSHPEEAMAILRTWLHQPA
jgi:flagellar M-ring protein FliF